jgi:hypothetical protein
MSTISPPLGRFSILDPTFELKRVSAAMGGTPVFDKWSDLDPTLAQKRINAVHAGAIDQWSMLDPQRWATAVQAAVT